MPEFDLDFSLEEPEAPEIGLEEPRPLLRRVDSAIGAFTEKRLARPAQEVIKGVIRGTENIMAAFGGLTRWYGEALGEVKTYTPDWDKRLQKKVSEKLTDWGSYAYDFWKENRRVGIEAPDPEVFKGTFLQNPSVTRGAAIIAEAIPSLGAATVASIATKNPMIGGMFLGFLEGSDTYIQAREAGVEIPEATTLGLYSSVGVGLLESIPLGRFMRGGSGRLGKDIFVGAVQEGTEEVAQALWQNVIAKVGFEPTRKLTIGMIEGFIGGAGSGGIV
ncbi:unnamed protein product, partial [marine sediment metagenome]